MGKFFLSSQSVACLLSLYSQAWHPTFSPRYDVLNDTNNKFYESLWLILSLNKNTDKCNYTNTARGSCMYWQRFLWLLGIFFNPLQPLWSAWWTLDRCRRDKLLRWLWAAIPQSSCIAELSNTCGAELGRKWNVQMSLFRICGLRNAASLIARSKDAKCC